MSLNLDKLEQRMMNDLRTQHPWTEKLLYVGAFLPQTRVPECVYLFGLRDEPLFAALFAEPDWPAQALRETTQYNMRYHVAARQYSCHSLVQELFISYLTPEEQRMYAAIAVRAVNRVLPEGYIYRTDEYRALMNCGREYHPANRERGRRIMTDPRQ